MDSIHQSPHLIPSSIQQGRPLSDKQLAQLESHPKAAGFQQLCLFNPAQNKHIASGVTQADLRQLEAASGALAENKDTALNQLLIAKGRNILIASGINPRRFTPEQQIHLSHLLGKGAVSSDWAQAIQHALAEGNLTADLVDSLIDAKIKGWEMVLDTVHSAAGNNTDLSALNAHEMHLLATLLLHEPSPISRDWIEQHAVALETGSITHADFEDILTQTKLSADAAALVEAKKGEAVAPKADGKAAGDAAPPLHEKGLEFAFKQQVCGFQSMSASWHTYIASEIAQQVIGEDGKVDNTAIAKMREEVQSDLFKQAGPKDPHQAQVLAMLDALENNDHGIRELVESIEAPKNPDTSRAAEKIRSTLGLPPDVKITPTHARQAALSALFSSMRQHSNVGSCFATAIAIRVHDNDPARLLREIKSLIEHDSIHIESEYATVEMPIATSVNISKLRKPLDINVFNNLDEPPYAIISQIGRTPIDETLSIHEIPGVQAALNALGIPEDAHNKAILEALKETGTEKTSLEAIFKQVIKNQGVEGKEAQGPFTRMADAFEAQENNSLLRSWEYTLAGFAGANIAGRNISSLKNAVIGAKIPGSQQKLLDGINDILKAVPDIGSKNILLNSRLQREFRAELGSRIQARFHASHSGLSETSESGWELYYTNQKGEQVTIQSDEDFKEYLLDTFERSCTTVKEYLSSDSRSFDQQRQGEQFPTEALCGYLRDVLNKEGLVQGIVEGVNKERGKKVLHREPAWFIRSGGFEKDVLRGYYAMPSEIAMNSMRTGSFKTSGNDFPSYLINNIKEGINTNGLTSIPKNITTGISRHVVNITTHADPKMQAILSSNTSLMELKEQFYKPGEALYDKDLSQDEIRGVLENVLSVVTGGPIPQETIDETLPDIMEDIQASNATGKPRELRETLGQMFSSVIQTGALSEDILDIIFIRALNPPSIAFADKNYFDDNGNGNDYVSFLYNPITGKVELWDTLNTGDGFTPISPSKQSYQETAWTMHIHPEFYPELNEAP